MQLYTSKSTENCEIHQHQRSIDRDTYTRVTRSSSLQVTWNQVQGLTRFGSQFSSTLSGSVKLWRNALSASTSEIPRAAGTDETTVRHMISSNSMVAIALGLVIMLCLLAELIDEMFQEKKKKKNWIRKRQSVKIDSM